VRALFALCLGLVLPVATPDAAHLALPPVPHYEFPGVPSPQPTTLPDQGSAPRNTEDNKSENRKSLWERVRDDAVAFATLCLVGVTGVLALSTIGLWIVTGSAGKRQSREMQKSIGVAERSLTELEAPFVYIEITMPGITYEGPNRNSFGDLKFRSSILGGRPRISSSSWILRDHSNRAASTCRHGK